MIWLLLKLSDYYTIESHKQKTFLAGRNGYFRVDMLRPSRQGHPAGELLHARHQCHGLCGVLASDHRFAVSSGSVGLLLWTNTLALWPTVTIRQNGFIGYTLALRLQCNGWCCGNLSSRFFYIKLEGHSKVRRYDTTWPWGSLKSRKEWVGPKVGIDWVCIFCCMTRWDENEMRSIYPGVSRIYTPRRSFHLCYRCIFVHPQSRVEDILGGRVRASLDMHLDAEIEWTQRCTLRLWPSVFGDTHAG